VVYVKQGHIFLPDAEKNSLNFNRVQIFRHLFDMSFKLWIHVAAVLKLPNQLFNITVFLIFLMQNFKRFIRLFFYYTIVGSAVDASVHLTAIVDSSFENFEIHRGFKIAADSFHVLGAIFLGE